MGRAREERREERKVASFGRRVTEHTAGGRTSLRIPEGLKMFNPENEGGYDIDFIPYEISKTSLKFIKNYAEVGMLYPERTYWLHRDVGVNNDQVVCPARTFGKPCPICEERSKYTRDPSKEAKEMVKNLTAKERQLWLIHQPKNMEQPLWLWDISVHNFGVNLQFKINNAPEDKKAERMGFFDPDRGLTLRLLGKKESAGGGFKYLDFTVDEWLPRKKALPKEVLDHGICLDDIPVEMPYDTIKKMFMMIQDEPEGDPVPAAGSGRDRDDDRPARDRDDDRPARGRREEPEDDRPARGRREEPAPESSFRKGDTVHYEYRGKDFEGKIVKVDEQRQLADVDVGEDRPAVVDLDDLKPGPLTKSRKTADDDDRPTRGRGRDAEDDRPARGRREEPEDDRPARSRSRDDDDDRPPARGRREEPEDDRPARRGRDADDDRAAPARGRGGRDEWDDEPLPPRGGRGREEPEEERPARRGR